VSCCRVFLCCLLLLWGCSPNATPPTGGEPEFGTGILVGTTRDEVVEGVYYHTATLSGTTNYQGHFVYLKGEQVSFSIGNILLGRVLGKVLVTPLDLAGTGDIRHPTAFNIVRLLHSVDSNSDPSDGIQIGATISTVAQDTHLSLNVSSETFATNPELSLLLNLAGKSLITVAEAAPTLSQLAEMAAGESSPPKLPFVSLALVIHQLKDVTLSVSAEANSDSPPEPPPGVTLSQIGPLKPVVEAMSDQFHEHGSSVMLSAQISNQDSSPVYTWVDVRWRQVSGPPVILGNAFTREAVIFQPAFNTSVSFVAPEVTGPTRLVFEVSATDVYSLFSSYSEEMLEAIDELELTVLPKGLDTVDGILISGRVAVTELEALFSRHQIEVDTELALVTVFPLTGEGQWYANLAEDGFFSVEVLAGEAYLIKAQTQDGTTLWGITPVEQAEAWYEVGLDTTYLTGMLFATSQDSLDQDNLSQLSELAAEALNVDLDRLVKTVRRITQNAILKKVDYAPGQEFNLDKLRAFGGGLHPKRSLTSVLENPQNDYYSYLYFGRVVKPDLPSSILMSEIYAGRWDYRMQGSNAYDGNPHVVNGGTLMVFASNRHCKHENESECHLAIYSLPLSAPADAEPTRLTDPGYNSQDPALSSDQQKIAFSSNQNGLYEIYVMNVDGSGLRQLTHSDYIYSYVAPIKNLQPHWSPDSLKIVYSSNNRPIDLSNKNFVYEESISAYAGIWLINVDGTQDINLTESNNNKQDDGPVFSPDGRQIAYFSRSTIGQAEIFIMDADGRNRQQMTFNNVPDTNPYWSHNGLNLVYTTADNSNSAATLSGLRVLTRTEVGDLGGFAFAARYERPVWAATPYLLVPTPYWVAYGEVNAQGYVSEYAHYYLTDSATPPPGSAYHILEAPTDQNWQIQLDIFNCCPNYVTPPIIW